MLGDGGHGTWVDNVHCTNIRLYHSPLAYVTGDKGRLHQTFDSCQKLSKAVFHLRQM